MESVCEEAVKSGVGCGKKMEELPNTEEERFTGADPRPDPPPNASNTKKKKKKKQGESKHDPNGEGRSFNNLDMIQGTGEGGSEQPIASIKKPSNRSPMKMKQTLKLRTDEIPSSLLSPTAAAQNVSVSTQSSHGNTDMKWQGSRRKRGRPRKFEAIEPQGNQIDYATPIMVPLETGQKKKRGRPRKALALTLATPDAADESFDDEPLSKFFEEMKTPNAGSNVEQQGDKSVQDPAATANGEVMAALSDPQGLPFVKNNTLVWDTIQSMDVFQKSPQNPHFQPLAHIKDGHREGLAIGYMVTFAGIAEKVCKIEIDGPRDTIEQLLETLGDLEPHGFDVEPIRGRLNEMLSYADKKEELQGLLSEISSETEKQTVDKAQMDEEVDELKKRIAELGKRLSHATSIKEAKEVDIASGKCRMEKIREDIANLCHKYETLMCKPF